MSTGSKNTIVINGKIYSATTGELMPGAPKSKNSSRPRGISMDGVVKSKAPQVIAPVQKKQPAATATPRPVNQHQRTSLQKSQTLMRQAVKKPTQTKTPAPSSPRPERTAHRPRQTSAHAVQKSPLVSRYGQPTPHSSVQKKVAPLAVKKPTPVEHPPHHKTTAVAAAKPAPKSTAQHLPKASKKDRHIEQALARATAHESQPTRQKTKRRHFAHRFGVSRRAASMSMAAIAGVLLVGFFSVQNVPNISMRMAAARAGFDASMPAYRPSGFRFAGPINYATGEVTIRYQSNTDEREYAVTQRESSWNSDALLSNFVVQETDTYQTYLDKGRTLFILNDSSATWIDNGIWYKIDGQSRLTTDQLIRIASSL